MDRKNEYAIVGERLSSHRRNLQNAAKIQKYPRIRTRKAIFLPFPLFL